MSIHQTVPHIRLWLTQAVVILYLLHEGSDLPQRRDTDPTALCPFNVYTTSDNFVVRVGCMQT